MALKKDCRKEFQKVLKLVSAMEQKMAQPKANQTAVLLDLMADSKVALLADWKVFGVVVL